LSKGNWLQREKRRRRVRCEEINGVERGLNKTGENGKEHTRKRMKKRGKEVYVGEKGGKESMMTESLEIVRIKEREIRKRIKKRRRERMKRRKGGVVWNWDFK
jgi:hypothetical protein